ncbi:hypothetical protein BH09ACT6_BH09ACT6_12300 [soil metagenome]
MAFSSEHPSQFDANDPLVARLREICLDFPETHEEETWGLPNFRVGKRIFVIAAAGREASAANTSMWFKPDGEERRAWLQQPGFFSPPYFGSKGWLGFDLHDDPGVVDWQLVAELCEDSFRLIALKRTLQKLDARR